MIMRKTLLILSALLVLLVSVVVSDAVLRQTSIEDGGNTTLRVIVEFSGKNIKEDAIVKALTSYSSVKIRHKFSSINGYSIEVSKSDLRRLERESFVKKTYPVRELHIIDPVKTRVKVSGASDNRSDIINVKPAWESNYTGEGILIAIVDTGVDENHPDLLGKVKDKVSFVDSETTEDGYGHGTHVASLAAGTGAASNGQYRGVAPKADLLNVKVCDSGGSCYDDDIIAGVEWAVEHQADVISMSIGGLGVTGTYPLDNAVNDAMDKGVVVVVAAGNEN